MAGMLFILFLLVSFCLLVFVSWLAARLVRRHGRRGWSYGVAVFMMAMGLLFWDWLPMEISYKNKCENEAGLTVYKTLEEWQAENPEVWEKLTPISRFNEEVIKSRGTSTLRSRLNERFAKDVFVMHHWFTVDEIRTQIVDMQTNIPMAVYVDFRAHPSGSLSFNSFGELCLLLIRNFRFWMEKKNCYSANNIYWGWQKPKELQERLGMESSRFYGLMENFKRGKSE